MIPALVRRIVCVLVFALVLAATRTGVAQVRCRVQFSAFSLTREEHGWRTVTRDTTGISGLLSDDLLISVDGNDASSLGPLAIAAFVNNSNVRAIPISVMRNGHSTDLILWQGDGKAPAPEKLEKKTWVERGEDAPAFRLPSLRTGAPVEMKDFRGTWVLLNFWATWCAPCRAESPTLTKLAMSLPEQLRVFAIAVQDEHKKVLAFADEMKAAYTVLESGDLKSTVALSFGVNTGMGSSTLPLSVLVRPDGTVAYVQAGYQEPSPLEQEVRSAIAGK